jgi:hypothetical protein
LCGSIFETFILSEIYKVFAHSGEEPPLFFRRDQTASTLTRIDPPLLMRMDPPRV